MRLEQLISDFWEVVLMVGIGTGISMTIAAMVFIPLFRLVWKGEQQ